MGGRSACILVLALAPTLFLGGEVFLVPEFNGLLREFDHPERFFLRTRLAAEFQPHASLCHNGTPDSTESVKNRNLQDLQYRVCPLSYKERGLTGPNRNAGEETREFLLEKRRVICYQNRRGKTMQEKQETADQRLRELCKRAAQEQDTKRLMELVKEIIDTYDGQRTSVIKKAGRQAESRT